MNNQCITCEDGKIIATDPYLCNQGCEGEIINTDTKLIGSMYRLGQRFTDKPWKKLSHDAILDVFPDAKEMKTGHVLRYMYQVPAPGYSQTIHLDEHGECWIELEKLERQLKVV